MYYKSVDYSSNKDCFNFLTNHFTYDTMNSWNELRSIAHNVKLYNLPVDYSKAMRVLEEDDYFTINETIRDWEADHPGFSVGFNGRSGGYLVLYSNEHHGHCFKNNFYSPIHYDDYESWKSDVQECYGSLKAYHSELLFEVKLVQDFDKLCDDLVEVLKEMIEEKDNEIAHTHHFYATRTYEHYVYDTKEDFEYHKKYMENIGYRLYEYEIDEKCIWAEYSMNESTEGDVVIYEE